MSQGGGMAGFAWPGAGPGTTPTASVSSVLRSPSATTLTALSSSVLYRSKPPQATSTASDGGAFFSSDVSTSATGSHSGTPRLPTALLDNPLNPNVAPPIDAPPSYVDYGTLPTAAPKATGVAFDRGTPFEMFDPTALATNMPTGFLSTFTKRGIPSFSTNPGPIIGAVVTVLCVILVLFLSIKYCIRVSSKTTDLEKGSDSRRRCPYYEEVTRGRRRHRDGSPPATRPDDIPISEGYGMDPVDLARAQNWQEGLGEKGVYATRDRVNRAIGADNFQSTSTHGSGNGSAYTSPQFPSFMPTRKLVPKPRPVTQLPVLSYDPRCTVGRPVPPLSANDLQNDHNCTRDYSDVSHLNPPTMPRGPSGWL